MLVAAGSNDPHAARDEAVKVSHRLDQDELSQWSQGQREDISSLESSIDMYCVKIVKRRRDFWKLEEVGW
jgi:hypothetical protein